MKKQKRTRRAEQHAANAGDVGEREVAEMIALAAGASAAGDDDLFDQAVQLLEAGPPWTGPDGPALVDAMIALSFSQAINRAWRNGWQPADIVRISRRSLDRTAADLSVDVIAADLARYATHEVHPQWRTQLAEVDATVWWADDATHLSQWSQRAGLSRFEALRTATMLIAVLHHLEVLPILCPIPGDPTMAAYASSPWAAPDPASQPGLERIRALLTKAESTTFPEEAEALSAKAQELMAALSIDRIALGADGTQQRPVGRRIGIEAPYAGPKSLLLDKVAQANRCRAVWTPSVAFSTVFGDEADVASVDMLFTSLLTQATAALRIADRQRRAEGAGRARSFRQSFHLAYALRIGSRLAEVSAATEASAGASMACDLLPVLAGHAAHVDEAVDSAFPDLVRRSVSASNRAGWASGTAAADVASLTVHAEVQDIASA